MTKFFKQGNGVLSLVVLTWLRQLQQFFLDDEHTHKNGDRNELGKYTGVTTNPMKDTTPLANINFSTIAKPKVLNQITNVNDFKPNEDITGVCTVCTSLEEWAFRILKPKQQFQLSELVETDSQTASRIKRVHEENQQQFKITTTDFTFNTNDVETGINNLAELDTNINRNKDLSFYKLALWVNKLIGESLQKAQNRQKNTKKKVTAKENKNIKQTYNAASAFATIMSSVLEREELFLDYNKMSEHINDQISKTADKNAKGHGKENVDDSDDESNNDDSCKRPPKKRRKLDTSSLFKTTGMDSDDDDDNVFEQDWD